MSARRRTPPRSRPGQRGLPRLGRHRHGRPGRPPGRSRRGQRRLGRHPARLRPHRRLLPRRPPPPVV